MQANIIKQTDSTYLFQGVLSFNTVIAINKKAVQMLSFVKEVIFDFGGITHCDSAGIALIVQWKKLAETKGTQIKFINIKPQMQKLMDLMGLSTIF